MGDFAQLVPTEEEQADEGGFQKERHQTLDGEGCAEYVANVLAIVAPIHAKLEFHGDAGRHTNRKVDAEQCAPELGHLPPDRAIGHHIDRFHDGDDDRQADGQRHEQEVKHRGGGEL